MRKLLPSLLIAIMALSVLSCAGVVSAKTATGSVHPLVIGPSTPQYYPVTAAVGNTYTFTPGDYNYYGTSLSKNPPGVATATANPNNGNLYAYESTKAIYAYEYAEALNGVNLWVKAPTTGATATTVTITVYEKAAFQTQVRDPFSAWGEMGTYSTYVYNGGYYNYYDSWYSTTNGKQTTNQAMTTVYTINPGNTFVDGWNTGNYYQVAGYLNVQSSGTTGSISAQGQVQSIVLQFS